MLDSVSKALGGIVVLAAVSGGCSALGESFGTSVAAETREGGAAGVGEGDGSVDGDTDAEAPVDGAIDGGALADGASDSEDGAAPCPTNAQGQPTLLECTGLYAVWSTLPAARVVGAAVVPFVPGYRLWSDGAEKTRYLLLPPGTQIATTDMNEWTFPVATKVWKEFRIGGKLIETRFMVKTAANQWFRTTYRWAADESSATELTTGATNVVGTYEIPAQAQCANCHSGRKDNVLGFEAISLAAPGGSVRGVPAGADLAGMADLLTNPPAGPLVLPGNDAAQAAQGFFHANCGTACHNRNPGARARSTGLFMRATVAQLTNVQATDLYTTAIGHPSNFQPVGSVGLLRVTAGDPSMSTIFYRDGIRDANPSERNQMPPLGTHEVDVNGLAIVDAWIRGLP